MASRLPGVFLHLTWGGGLLLYVGFDVFPAEIAVISDEDASKDFSL